MKNRATPYVWDQYFHEIYEMVDDFIIRVSLLVAKQMQKLSKKKMKIFLQKALKLEMSNIRQSYAHWKQSKISQVATLRYQEREDATEGF